MIKSLFIPSPHEVMVLVSLNSHQLKPTKVCLVNDFSCSNIPTDLPLTAYRRKAQRNSNEVHVKVAKHYLHSCVPCHSWRLVVDWYDSHWDCDREAPALYLISRSSECKTVLGALCAVMHVVDVSKFHLEKTKKDSVVTQFSIRSEC